MNSSNEGSYDAEAKEAQLRAESEMWDTSQIESADERDIPVIDVSDYLADQSAEHLKDVSEQLLKASTQAGFYYLKGHGISQHLIANTFAESRRFHNLPIESKLAIKMDQEGSKVGGVGYLPFQNRKLPTRKMGNANEAFIVKQQAGKVTVSMNDNLWPSETSLPGFRKKIVGYASRMQDLALKLIPIYGQALGLQPGYFDEAFETPMFRLRMTKYPPIKSYQADEFGIGPHVDSTFFTILAQDKEGLIIFGEKKKKWLLAPVRNDCFIVNTGELLRQWTNDYFISVKHFANNNYSSTPRYSIPFFFNAHADYKMTCLPTCTSTENPPKYPPFSYLESQASVQGE